MSGILDSKSRIIDAIVTQEGRRQMATGKMRIDYVAFSDAAAFYMGDVVSGSNDATKRLYLEACNLPQDQITFESDDSGRLVPFGVKTELAQLSGQLLSRSLSIDTSVVTGSNVAWTNLTGSEFSSTAHGVLSGTLDNFRKLRVIGSFNELFGDAGFAVGPDRVNFVLTDGAPIVDESQFVCSVNDLESLFNDPRLSNAANFKYLPPVNKGSSVRVGDYPPWGSVDIDETVSSLRAELAAFELNGLSRAFSFDPTSNEHNLLGQFFEITNDSMIKLDVIRFGEFMLDSSVNDVFFIGKVKVDDFGAQSFVHLFTLLFG